jgi:hypothetical protein
MEAYRIMTPPRPPDKPLASVIFGSAGLVSPHSFSIKIGGASFVTKDSGDHFEMTG